MKYQLSLISLFVAVVFLGLTLSGVTYSQKVENRAKSDSVRNSISSLNKSGAISILKPSEIARLTKGAWLMGDPCNTALPISFGQTINGALTSTDCQLEDLSFADFYSFTGTAGRQVTINMSSAQFDTYLGLSNEAGTMTWEDDDGGGGTNSRIVADLNETGIYIIAANSFDPNTFGNYQISLADTTPCSFILSPSSQVVPAVGGAFMITVTASDQNCQWTATSFDAWVTTTSSGTGNGTVDYTVAPSTSQNQRFASLRINNNVFSIMQEAIFCTLSFNPPNASFPSAGGSGSFTVTTQPACSWTATGGVGTSSSSSGTGNGTVDYTVGNNNGGQRDLAIFVTTQTRTTNFPISQAGLNCTYAVSDREIYVGPFQTTGVIKMTTGAGCQWNVSSNSGWVPVSVSSGSGSGDIPYTVLANPGSGERSAGVSITGVQSVFITQGRTSFRIPFDFDGDSRTDVSIYRPNAGQWWYLRSSDGGNRGFQFGNATDKLVPADFTGDGKTDVALWRESSGEWFILRSENGSFYSFPFGTSGDIPAPGDFDGDGKADAAVFRPSNGFWYIQRSSDGVVIFQQFGVTEDKPVVADYDRDGKSDIAVFRPSVGQWWIYYSLNSNILGYQFGSPGDIPVPQDYSGDDADDIAIFRPSTGYWYILRSENNSLFGFPFGSPGDIPVPGDYDRDGIADAGVFRPSENFWYLSRTNDGFYAAPFGTAGDKPLPSVFLP